MVEKEKISFLFLELDKFLSDLENLKQLSYEEFVSDVKNVYSLKYLFQVSIETCINISNHLISRLRLGVPKEYAEIFKILGHHNIISKETMQKLIVMTKFRNRLVHVYWDIDDEAIFTYLNDHLSDFYIFQKEIKSFISDKIN
jgi:uncharacterized protein YutE (UPF0331/DUF86 family)